MCIITPVRPRCAQPTGSRSRPLVLDPCHMRTFSRKEHDHERKTIPFPASLDPPCTHRRISMNTTLKHLKIRLLSCVFVPVLAILLLTAGVAQAAGLTCGAWNVVRSPGVKGYPELRAVAAISTSDAWAVGEDYLNSGDILTLTEHWNGTSWSVIPSPNPGVYPSNGLYGVAAVSTSDVWAVGYAAGGDGASYQTLNHNCNGTSGTVSRS